MDYIFVAKLGWGMEGAAWATTLSYVFGGVTLAIYYLAGKAELKIKPKYFKLEKNIVAEIASIGMVSMVRQGSISILTIILNHSLFYYGVAKGIGGEMAVSIYGIVNRIAMFAFFPLIGIAQGMMPIVGYNFGAKQFDRVKEVVRISVIWGFAIAGLIASLLLGFSDYIPGIFNNEALLLEHTPPAIFWVFLATPLLILQLVGATYYQAIGKGLSALLLTLTKQGFFLIPIVLILPNYFGLEGVWFSFPIADALSAAVCYYFLIKGLKKLT
jgi:Na+-driven multidrug efflux pump